MKTIDAPHQRVLILAPTGRDATAIAEVLSRAGMQSLICADAAALTDALTDGAGAAMVAEEALLGRHMETLTDWAAAQPPWSDMPFIILTSRQARPEVLRWRQDLLAKLRGASLLERPLDALTLSTAARSAARARARQYELRAHMAARAAATETLEHQVAARTAELETAVSALRTEMAERTRVEDALRQSQKMEAVGQLTGGLAHDFNNMLTGIIGSLEMMQTRVGQGRAQEVGRFVDAAMSSANRAAALTHRLLAFSRRQTLSPKPLDAGALIGGMEDLIRRTVGPAIRVQIESPAGLWTTRCDPNQLESALLNLVINARDAMPDGGTLRVAATNKRPDDPHFGPLPSSVAEDYVLISVSDTGTGMAEDVVARAFDPFFTTKPTGAGTGLGLSMVFGFVNQSGGRVRIASQPGEGTTIRLYLPRSYLAPALEPRASADPMPRAHAGETVLVVDDESAIRMLIREVLEELGYTPAEACDAQEGLEILQSGRKLDLMITDVGLPNGMNGRQLADLARRERPGLQVLFITGYAEQAALGADRLEPGMDVITKPFALHELATRIRTMIEVR
jgi:signal transduction histidine kinase